MNLLHITGRCDMKGFIMLYMKNNDSISITLKPIVYKIASTCWNLHSINSVMVNALVIKLCNSDWFILYIRGTCECSGFIPLRL